MCNDSKTVVCGDGKIARRSIDNIAVNRGVVSFIEQVVQVSLHRQLRGNLITPKQIDQCIATLFSRKRRI